MRTAGFPCRVLPCDRSFQVADQSSMESLGAASRARAEHELAAHGYRHVPMTDERARGWTQRPVKKPEAPKAR